MIGMNQIKKRLIHGILIGLGVGILGIIITLLVTNNIIKGYEEGTSEKFNQQYMTQVVTFNRDVIQGERITESMVQENSVPKTTLPVGAYTSGSSIVGQIVKYNVPRNVAIISNMLGDYIVGADVRIQEINAIVMPSDLVEGEYIDIRLMLPSGVEYIVLPQKQVKQIIGDTIKMDLSEEEILLLNSAIIDSYLTEGSKLYSVKYTDPTTQIKVSQESMDKARDVIARKLADDLVKKGAITLNTEEAEKTVNTIVNTVVDKVTTATGDGTTELVPATDGNAVQVTPDEYIFSVSELKADDLVNLISQYAIEYRYYVESYDKVEATYQPNEYIMDFVKTSGSKYLEIAKTKLNEAVRISMETNIKNFMMSQTEEEYEDLVEKLEDSIAIQKSLRSAALN